MKKFIFLVCAALFAFTSCEKDEDPNSWLYGTWQLYELSISQGDGYSITIDKAMLDENFFGAMKFDNSGSCNIIVKNLGEDFDNTPHGGTIVDQTLSYTISGSDLKVGKYNTEYSHNGEELIINGDGSFICDKLFAEDTVINMSTAFKFSKID